MRSVLSKGPMKRAPEALPSTKRVCATDPDPEKIDDLKSGIVPFRFQLASFGLWTFVLFVLHNDVESL